MNYQTADLSNLFIKRPYRRERVSSFDRSGLNDDRIHIASGQTKEFACIEGPAVINMVVMFPQFWEAESTSNVTVEPLEEQPSPSVQRGFLQPFSIAEENGFFDL